MKSLITILFALAAGIFCSSFVPGDDCDPDKLLEKNTRALKEYKFVKSFPVEITKNGDKSEHSYVLSKDMKYRIIACQEHETGNHIVVNVLGRDKKVLASNFTKSTRSFERTIDFVCPATGVYYIESYFDHESKGCGLNILGYKK